MTESYANAIGEARTLLIEAILSNEPDLADTVRDLDAVVLPLVRELGRSTIESVVNAVGAMLTEAAGREGLTVHRKTTICFSGVLGPIQVESVYLYDAATRRSSHPVGDRMRITHQGRSRALDRALTDFGAEESFGHGAERFEEHYGFSVNRTTVMRVTEREAESAEAYVRQRLQAERSAFEEPLKTRPGADQILTELDGCEIRTGTLQPAPGSDTTPVGGLPRHRRVEEWREVRVGLARRLEEVRPTYVAEMASYPEVVSSLFDAAVSHGLSPQTETIAVADGGNGLKEELEVQFPNLTFILDRPHLQKHLHESADAMGLQEDARQEWLCQQTARIDTGHVSDVIHELRRHHGQGNERIRQLAGYLERFRDCVQYDAYKARGLPLGSGEVESAHRSIPQKRLKLPGACWKPETINPMLALRVLRANDWWNDFWKAKKAA